MNKITVTLLLIVFVTGIYVVMTFPSCGCKKKENFANRECPELYSLADRRFTFISFPCRNACCRKR